MNNITLTISQEEANECLKALIFRADTLNEKKLKKPVSEVK